ncbi:MAG: hypothetical protein RMJ55_07100 [Roseiflexaceae bacterium]|nr:hypothetical protein [Roseiflexus sp.]MDW8213305.1 hypothetical protein [Roseiflexaceae bacterium]
MDDELLLGYVVERFRNKDDIEVALLRPQYRFDKRSRGWQPIQDVMQEFPNRGGVTWVRAPSDAEKDTVWLFEYSEHEHFDPANPRLDRYRIDFDRPPEEPIEVLAVAVSDEDRLRRALLKGLIIRFIPSRQVYVTIDDSFWIGPLRLVPKDQEGKNIRVLDPGLQANPVPRVIPAESGDSSVLTLNGARRRFLHPKTKPLAPIGQMDFADDYRNLKRVLEWCRKRPEVAKALDLTKKVIDETINALPEGDEDLWAQRVQRARRYIERLEQTAIDLSAFEEALLKLPRVRERLAAAEREGRAAAQAREEERLIAEARQELERVQDDLRQKQEDLRQKIDQLSQLRQEVEEWERMLADRKQQLSNQLDLVDETLRKRIAVLFQKPVEALAQIALLRAALGVNDMQANRRIIVPVGAARLTPPETALRNGEAHIADETQLLAAVRQGMIAIGEEASLAVKIHSAFASGLMPLLTGPGALAALEAYAQAVSGGRVVWVPVTPTVLKPADLFGDVHPVTGRFMPHPAGLLDLLLFAAQPEQCDKLFIVVLDGVNRAAVDAFLLPVLACYNAAWSDHVRRALPIIHPGLIDPSSPYAAAARLVWPKNALLAGTLVDGAATAPLSPDLWAYACVIETGRGRIGQKNRTSPQCSEVTLSAWATWRSVDPETFQEAANALNELNDANADTGFRAPAAVLEACARLEARMAACSGKQPREFAVRSVLAPYAFATGQSDAFAQAMETLGVEIGTDVHDSLKAILA